MARKGETVSYSPPSFEECYSKKLNEIKVALKGVLYGDTPFVVGLEYACKKEECSGRINIHSQAGKWFCLLCALRPGAVAPRWSKTTRAKVEEIMASYPDPEQSREEWQAKYPQKKYVPDPMEPRMLKVPAEEKVLDPQRVEFGQRIRQARIAKGFTVEQLASQIIKQKKKESLSSSAIQMYESGAIFPPEHVMAQLVQILGLKVEKVEV